MEKAAYVVEHGGEMGSGEESVVVISGLWFLSVDHP